MACTDKIEQRTPPAGFFVAASFRVKDISGTAIEMVRIAPSASNKHPWRVVLDETGKSFHFFMERTPGYNNNPLLKSDLQRIDTGVAMYHFEAAVKNAGLKES